MRHKFNAAQQRMKFVSNFVVRNLVKKEFQSCAHKEWPWLKYRVSFCYLCKVCDAVLVLLVLTKCTVKTLWISSISWYSTIIWLNLCDGTVFIGLEFSLIPIIIEQNWLINSKPRLLQNYAREKFIKTESIKWW